MRIFLSYARERVSEAQQIDAALEAEGHEVFFARDSITAGSQFGRAIREAVGATDLFVFLISPESVEPGSYCLTELGFARERWPKPADRVLPVVVTTIAPESLPPQLQSLSALYPTGNLAAEVVACVQEIAGKRRRARLRVAAVALAALCAVVGVGAAVRRGSNAEPRPFLSVVAVADPRPAVAGMPALVELRGNARNPLPRIDSIVGLVLELEGALAEPEGGFDPILLDANGGQNFFQWFRVSADGDSLVTPRRWRACIRHAGRRRQTCANWSDWDAGPLMGVVPLAERQRSRSRVVASAPAGFLVGLASPHQLLVLSSSGDSARPVSLPGEPTAIAVAGDRIAVGTRAPGVLVVLGPGGERSEYQVPGGVASVALAEREAWVITGDSTGDPALRLLDLPSGRWVPLPYSDDFELDARGLRLRTGPLGDVWAVSAGTTSHSLYHFGRKAVVATGDPAVSCAGDIAPASDRTVRLLSCEGVVLEVRPRPDGMTTVADWYLRLLPLVKGDWRTEWLGGAGDTLAVAITILRNAPDREDQVPLMSRIAWAVKGSRRSRIAFERDSLAVTSLAVRDTVALATVTSAHGVRDLIAVPIGGR
jgi:hypothetical protein